VPRGVGATDFGDVETLKEKMVCRDNMCTMDLHCSLVKIGSEKVKGKKLTKE